MANIKKIDGKTGPAFKITVFAGRDLTGKQLRHYKTWTPDRPMSDAKMDKEVQRVAFDFEREIELGFQADNRQTFAEYAEYVIDLKERTGAKHNTIFSYRYLLERIVMAIGHLKLTEIRPQHLNAFYKNLTETGVRKDAEKATAKQDISKILKNRKTTRSTLAVIAGVSPTTITTACRGEAISLIKAQEIAVALGAKVQDLFTIERNAAPLSAKSILEYHRLIHTVLDQAEKEMLVPYNAASKATPPRQRPKEVNYFQPDELGHILDALEDEPLKWRTITHLLIVTGCRRGEVMGLKWSKVDFGMSRVRIDTNLLYTSDRGIYEGTTKTGDVRFIKLPAETMELLKAYRRWYLELKLKNGDRWHDTDFLFVKDDGRPMQPDSIGAWLSDFAKRHRLPHINPHAFRHTVASVLINSGTDIVSVSKRLGHTKTSTTTDIYSHIISEADEQASECIADVMLRRKKA